MLNILNINNFSNKPLDKSIVLALDTNVLLWTFYSRCSITKSYQKNIYPNFITNLISNGNDLIVLIFNLNEMFHVIEKNEYDIYSKEHGNKATIKSYRKIEIERNKVKKEIQLIYKQLKTIPNVKIIGSNAELADLDTFTKQYDIHNCDFFDFCLIDYCNKNSISIVTDDCDFNNSFNVSDIYTANPKLINL